MKIEDLGISSRRVNLIGRVVEVGEERSVISRSDGKEHRVADVLLGDDSGCIKLTLWDDNIDEVSVGDVLDIKNGYVNVFKGSMRLNIGRFGSFKKSDEEVPNVNLDNNLSERAVAERYGVSFYGRSRGRTTYRVICSECGRETEVPFKPIKGRPVYCRDCYLKRKRSTL